MKESETQTASVTEPEDRFERIGTTYYKMVSRPNAAGELIECRIPWTIEAIRQDYGKDFVAGIPKYDGFCCVPAHVGSLLSAHSSTNMPPSATLPEKAISRQSAPL